MSIHVSANKLAEFIAAKTPERRRAIVRELRRSRKGYPPPYGCFRKPAKKFLVGGALDPQPVVQAIKRMEARRDTEWKQHDSLITIHAFNALLKAAPAIRALGVEFALPPPRAKARLAFGDVTVTATPDLLVRGERNGAPLLGALRFYIAKGAGYELGRKGSELVSVLEHRWLVSAATGERAPDASLCMVFECFQERITAAPERYDAHVAEIERGCAELSRIWHLLDGQEAA